MALRLTHPVDHYALRVLDRDPALGPAILAGPLVRLAAHRHLKDRQAAHTKDIPWQFSFDSATNILDFFHQVLRLPDTLDDEGNPRPFTLEPALAFIIGSMMGWLGPDGTRRYREAYIEMGKGNAKTPMLAGLGLYGLTLDPLADGAPEIYAAATTRDQAQIMFRDAVRMVQAAPILADSLIISGIENPHNISNPENLGFFRPFSREQGLRSGIRPHMALVDEVHEHPSPEVINKMKAGFKRRPSPILGCITNSGFDRTSICYQMHRHAEDVLEGTVEDPHLFAYVCALDEGEDPLTDEACWAKTNPLLTITVPTQYLRRQVQNAANLIQERNIVLRLNFCVWTEQDERWLAPEVWQACGGPVDLSVLTGEYCYGGLDLASRHDVTAFVLVFPGEGVDEEGEPMPLYTVLPTFWVPEEALAKRSQKDGVPYDQWARDGYLLTTPGNVTDYDQVRHDILALASQYDIQEIAYDRWEATQLVAQLDAHGLVCTPMGQGYASMTAAVKELGKLVAGGQIRHGSHPVLDWMAGNVAIETDPAGNMKLSRKRSREKIDGMVALAEAIDRATRIADTASVYDEADAEVFVV